MPAIRCPRCALSAHDNVLHLFGTAHLAVSDDDCSYFVEGREYFLKCEYVRGARDSFFSTTDNPCPNLKDLIALGWRR
jgi:hypothetical protein